MFVIRRKSDGKFWRNRKGTWWRAEDVEAKCWTDNINQVKPFVQRGHGRNVGKLYIGDAPRRLYEACCNARYRDSFSRICDCAENHSVARRAWWDARYEIVEVEMSVSLKED